MKLLPAIERRRITNMIMRYLKPNTKWMKTMILGRPFVVETKEWERWASDYEPHTTDYIRENVKKGDMILDIGAHVGYYTLLFAELVGPEGIVWAFEPNPDVMKVLRHNVRVNGYDNVRFMEMAVSDSNGRAKFFIPEVTDCASLNPMGGVRKVLEVVTTYIDYLHLHETFGIDFIKMDVEGAEYEALKGMRATISQNPKMKLVVEFRPLVLGEKANLILEMFKGYSIIGMDDNLVIKRN